MTDPTRFAVVEIGNQILKNKYFENIPSWRVELCLVPPEVRFTAVFIVYS
jgi:hypothetical protein